MTFETLICRLFRDVVVHFDAEDPYGELLDAGGDVDGVADQREFQLACAAYGARYYRSGIYAYSDSKSPLNCMAT